MKISVNEKEIEIDESASIPMLLEKTNSPQQGVAVAINDTVIPRSEWDEFRISESDTVLIIKAAQGG